MLRQLRELFIKWRYPVSSPEDVGEALGTLTLNTLTFDQFVGKLMDPNYCPTNLKRFMPREEAEKYFRKALIRDQFDQETMMFYYFNEGWMEFDLHFDDRERLRRVYLRHKHIDHDMGVELKLDS